MTTRILNQRNQQVGDLVRLFYGQPLVRYDGDHTVYRSGWSRIAVTSSDEYQLPDDGFARGLFVDPNGDVWRRTAVSTWGSPWPCQDPETSHFHGGRGTLCWHCGQPADTELFHDEVFTLVSAEGFPAESARSQTRAEVEEWTAGPLLPVGSAEARERATVARASQPTPGEGCGMRLGIGVMTALVLAVVVLAVVRLATA